MPIRFEGDADVDNIAREHIAALVKDGFVMGFYPKWEIKYLGINKNEISCATFKHISKCIENGYRSGEIIEDDSHGWWKLAVLL